MLPKINVNNAKWAMQNIQLYVSPERKVALSSFDIIDLKEKRPDFHTHEDTDILIYVLEGRVAIELEDGKLFMTQGDVTLIPKGVVHRVICKVTVKCLIVEVDKILNNDNRDSVLFIASVDRRGSIPVYLAFSLTT